MNVFTPLSSLPTIKRQPQPNSVAMTTGHIYNQAVVLVEKDVRRMGVHFYLIRIRGSCGGKETQGTGVHHWGRSAEHALWSPALAAFIVGGGRREGYVNKSCQCRPICNQEG